MAECRAGWAERAMVGEPDELAGLQRDRGGAGVVQQALDHQAQVVQLCARVRRVTTLLRRVRARLVR